jgi:prepilin-type N-terminal cleavage/methylation domain-containing protein
MKYGFTLIEIMLVILIMGIIASIGIPRFTRGTITQGEQFIARLNALTQYGAQEAIRSSSMVSIHFNLLGKNAELLKANKSVKKIDIPSGIDITDFFVNGINQFSTTGGERRSAWLYISPEGIAQEVKIVFIDKIIQTRRPQAGRYEIDSNPFTALFKVR